MVQTFTFVNDCEWKADIDTADNRITVTCDSHDPREYGLSGNIVKVEQKGEYLILTRDNGEFYQFKFELFGFLAGDLFAKNDELIEEIACHVFEEEDEEIDF